MAGSAKSIEQQIADKEAQLSRLRDKQRKLENGQKIILGGLLLNEMRANEKTRAWILKAVSEKVTRKADKERLEPLLKELRELERTETASSRAGESQNESDVSTPSSMGMAGQSRQI